MTTIDHRILIPAAPDVVWDYVSDITHNPDWQIDCHDVIFLTSRREGPGVRWRYATPSGHEYVIAVTAWYNGLGYEYYFVDGAPFRENKGRIRLQEIPEGTIVQWTFTYELGGLLGGMRNALGTSRQVDHTIAESLKTLWQKIKQSGAAARPHEAKSLMRDAPDVDARSAYQPRHPTAAERPDGQKTEPTPISKVQFEPPISEDDGQAISIIDEPPIAEGDTRPRPAATIFMPPSAEPVPVISTDTDEEPDFLDRMVDPSVDLSRFEPPRDPSDTQPRKPVDEPPAPLATAELPEEESEDSAPSPTLLKGEETEPLSFPLPESLPVYAAPLNEPEPAPESEPEAALEPEQPTVSIVEFAQEETQLDLEAAAPSASDEQTSPSPVSSTAVIEEIPPAPVKAPESAPSPEPKSTAEMASIWEVFGLPRPSETQETAAAVSAKPEPEPIVACDEPIIEPTSEIEAPALEPVHELELAQRLPEKTSLPRGSSRIGLRIVLRRKLVRVRRP